MHFILIYFNDKGSNQNTRSNSSWYSQNCLKATVLTAATYTKHHFMWLRFSYITFFVCYFSEDEDSLSRVAGSSIFTFQKAKRGHSMAQTGESLQSPPSYIQTCIVWHQLHLSGDCQCLFFVFFLEYHTYCFCVLIHSKWVSSDSRENCDLQHDPQRWALHSHPNRPQWVQHNCFVFFVCVLLRTTESIFSLCLSSARPERWKQDIPEGESIRNLFAWHQMLMFYKLWLCCRVRDVVFSVSPLLFVWQRKKVQFVSTTPHRLRKRLTSEFNMLQWKYIILLLHKGI